MPTSVGPNPSADNSIVFSYDVGDTSNSYIGEPTTNTVGNLNSYNPLDLYTWASTGNTSTWSRDTTIFPSPVNGIPLKELSFGTDSYSDTYNTTQDNISAASSGQIWTVSVYALAAAGTNLQVWIFGSNSSGNYIELDVRNFTATGAWQRISVSMTFTNGSTAYVQARVATATNGATIWWDGLQVEQKSNPTQFTTGTRSTTQGLLPLINNPTINLSSVSFDSNAQIIWDGTDDTISINSYPAIELVDNVSIEYVYMRLSTDPVLDVIANKYHDTGWELFCQTGATFALAGRNGDGTYYATSNPAYTIQNNQYYHLVAIKDGFSWRLYVNGQLYSYLTAGTIGTWSNSGILQIGGEGSGYYPHMKLPIFKIYNTVLSADQVQQNYRQYKSRFNLS
jgi:hypothetical protein